MSFIDSIIETQEFATLPPVAARVLKLLEDDNSDVRDISHVIETDASLTLKLLRVANSPLYASRVEINSVQQAIITLGLNRLTNIVLGVSIFSRFLMSSQKRVAELMEKFWWHASCTGIAAKALSTKLKKFFKENEFIGGLLHDIGKLAMIQYDSTKYTQVVDLMADKMIMDVDAEMEIFGANHLQVGERIARLWKLPEELTNVIAYHNTPELVTNHRELVAIVRLADMLCEIWGASAEEGFRAINFAEVKPWEVLTDSFPELKLLDIEAFTFELEEEFKKATEFLNILVSEGK